MSGVQFALRFISGKYQGGEFPLKEDREIVIGRSSELDMVLVEDMVSRQHARITTQQGKIVIEDLGSTNGTFVNGEKVKEASLKESDRVLIGTSIIKLINASEMGDAQASTVNRSVSQSVSQRRTLSGGSSMVGTIDEIPLPDLLQLLSTSKKSGVLEIEGDRGLGRIYLRKGQVYYASIDDNYDIGPRKAFYRMVIWETGTFELAAPDDKEFHEQLEDSTEGLLMESMRQLDEITRLQPELPHIKAALEITRPLGVPLHDLPPEQLDLLQLVHNHESIQEVLDHSPLTDLDVYEGIFQLFEKGYINAAVGQGELPL